MPPAATANAMHAQNETMAMTSRFCAWRWHAQFGEISSPCVRYLPMKGDPQEMDLPYALTDHGPIVNQIAMRKKDAETMANDLGHHAARGEADPAEWRVPGSVPSRTAPTSTNYASNLGGLMCP